MYVKEMFFSQRLADKNSQIMDKYFTLNKKLDNFMDYLDIELVMNKFSERVHLLAHQAPLDADRFRDYNALYSFRTHYNAIEGQYKNFNSILEGISEILDYLADITNDLYDAKNLGEEEDNQDYVQFIWDEIKNVRGYKKVFTLMFDKVEKSLSVGKTIQDIDYHAEDYILEYKAV